jgi:hypothetical protein
MESATNSYRCTVQLASEFGELSITTIEQCTKGIAVHSSLEEVECLCESGSGSGSSIWMNFGHDINPSFVRWRVTSITSWRT